MKNKISGIFGAILLFILLTPKGDLLSQTPGTFSFSVTTTSSGGFSPEHLLAIWLENSSTSFIKTKIMYSSNDDLDHMQTWVSKSGNNVIDAVTGPSRTSHGTITFLWNGTNVAGTVVPDGSYSVWLEMAWGSSLTTGKTVDSYAFTKGVTEFHSQPGNTDNFSSLALDWVPLITGIEGSIDSKDISVYPNPSTGLLNVDFKHAAKDCIVRVVNESGKVVYKENIPVLQEGIKTFDFTRLVGGIYYINMHFPDKDLVFRIILVK
jgi:hypothetical protein